MSFMNYLTKLAFVLSVLFTNNRMQPVQRAPKHFDEEIFYSPELNNDTLIGIKQIKPSPVLNFSGLNIKGVHSNYSFPNFDEIRSIDLSASNISHLPERFFSNLPKLEYLSLAINAIKETKNVFVGLGNLRILNLTSNPLGDIRTDNFRGLSEKATVLLKGSVNGTKIITGDAFGGESSTSVDHSMKRNGTKGDDPNPSYPRSDRSARATSYYGGCRRFSNEAFRPQICIRNSTVQRLELSITDEEAPPHCRKASFSAFELILRGLNLSNFEDGWYRLQNETEVPKCLASIDLSNNDINQVTNQMLNGLPRYINKLTLQKNGIKRLTTGSFDNENIYSLDLNYNMIDGVEDDAFRLPDLMYLRIRHNRLKDTKFFATLPGNVIALLLAENNITKILSHSFVTMRKIQYLDLSRNKITTLESDCLAIAITTIDKGAMIDLRHLKHLNISGNPIKTLQNGAFLGLPKSESLHVYIGNVPLEEIQVGIFENV